MLGGLLGSYRFPKLAWYEAVQLHKDREGTTNVYVMCWDDIDELVKNVMHETSDCDYTLPDQFRAIAEGPFAITPEYYKAISHFTQMALVERVPRWNFDTMIREICYEPSITAANTAFKLLADCAYDPKTGFYDRGPKRKVRQFIMRYYFWLAQTGSGLIKDYADFKKLEFWIGEAAGEIKNGEYSEELDLLTRFNSYAHQILAHYEKSRTPVVGGSIEPASEAVGFNDNFVTYTDKLQVQDGKIYGYVNLDHSDHELEVFGDDKLVPEDHDHFLVPLSEKKKSDESGWARVSAKFNGEELFGYFRPHMGEKIYPPPKKTIAEKEVVR